MNYFDQELQKLLEEKEVFFQIGNSEVKFEWIEKNLPIKGSFIDWEKAEFTSDVSKFNLNDSLSFDKEMLLSLTEPYARDERITYVGDNLDVAYLLELEDLNNLFFELISMTPQQHYFIDTSYRWFLNVTFDNFVFFKKFK